MYTSATEFPSDQPVQAPATVVGFVLLPILLKLQTASSVPASARLLQALAKNVR